MKTEFYFATEAEARAFWEGAEYVNDGAIELISICRVADMTDHPWQVAIEDSDRSPE